jgi:hypothetical protein
MPMSPRDRRALILLGSVLVVAAVVFFLFVMRGSEGEPAGSVQGPVAAPVAPPASPSPAQTQPAPERLVFTGRDPFDPSQGGGTIQPLGGSSGPAPHVAPPGTPPPAPPGGSSANVGGKTVVLLDIFIQGGEEMAQVEVDGTVYTVGEGDSFDDNYRLVSITGSCADFLYGDQSFTLCEAQNK